MKDIKIDDMNMYSSSSEEEDEDEEKDYINEKKNN
jgi:hypothetical protein